MAMLITTPVQRKVFRLAFKEGTHLADAAWHHSGLARVMTRMGEWGWLDRVAPWHPTPKGREVAGEQLGLKPEQGDALRLHLVDHGQDLTHIDVHVTNRPSAKIYDCPQFWMWGNYEITNGHFDPLKFRAGQFLRLDLRAEHQAKSAASKRIDLRYPIERVEFLGDGAKLAAEVAKERAA